LRALDELLDFDNPVTEFSLVKGALLQIGFPEEDEARGPGASLGKLLERFGGGLEITTLAALPKGSGLGTSSIMWAVVLAVLHRASGRELSSRELFHATLRLEQALTTGGGWQDQVGGAVGQVKLVSAEAGLVPD